MGLVAGVLTLDAILLAVGFCLLAPYLRARGWHGAPSYAGLAFLLGAGATIVVLHGLVVFGVHSGPPALAVVAACLGVAGLVVAWRRGPAAQPSAAGVQLVSGRPDWRGLVEVAAAGILVALLGLMVVAAFRTAPFLDDTWGIWIARALPLEHVGLDARIFTPSFHYLTLDHPDYPLWWSLLTGLDMRFVGSVDLRVTTGQSALLVLALFGAAARLLWGAVRPWVLWPGLLLLAASPELLRQTQSGGADVPLAVYLALLVLGAGVWLWRADTLGLGVVVVAGAAALLIKSEGAPQVAILAVLLAVFGWPFARRRVWTFAGAVVAAVVAASPWLIWRQAHDVQSMSDVGLGNALSPSYLFDRTDRVGPAANKLAYHLTNPREWLIIVPLAVVASLVVAWRARRVTWLAPAAVVLVGYAFWIWVNWADTLEVDYRLGTSSYRVIDAVVLIAGLSIPVLVERLMSVRSPETR
jgi:hypothetical protein